MAWRILMDLAIAATSAVFGALMSLRWCSRQSWCPRYLRHRLDAWRKQMQEQNEERHMIKLVEREPGTPSPGGGGEVA